MPDALASVFADPQDLQRYQNAIANGATQQEALKVGDNGQGAWGDNTATNTDPIVALPTNTPGAAHNRLVQIQGANGSVIARVADTGAPHGRIDLNPAAAATLGHPGGLHPVTWNFLDGYAKPPPQAAVSGSSSLAPAAPPSIPAVNLDDSEGAPSVPEVADNSPADQSPTQENDPLSPQAVADAIANSPRTADNSDQSGPGDFTGEGQLQSTDNPTSPVAIAQAISDNQPAQPEGVNISGAGVVRKDVKPPEPGNITGEGPNGEVYHDSGVTYFPQDKRIEWTDHGSTFVKRPGSPTMEFPQKQARTFPDGQGHLFAVDPTTGKTADVTPPGFQAKAEEGMLKRLADVDVGDATGPAVLDKVPPDLRSTIKAYAEYRNQPLSSFALRSPYMQKFVALMNAYDPTYDSKEYANRQALMKDFSSGPISQNINSLNTVVNHLGNAADAFNDLGNSDRVLGGRVYNQLKNFWLDKAGGFASVGKFGSASNAVANEMARAVQGGAPNESEIQSWQKNLADNADTPRQFAGQMQEGANLIAGRMAPLYAQYSRVMGKDLPYTLLSPEAHAVLDKTTAKVLNDPNASDDDKAAAQKTRDSLHIGMPTAPFVGGAAAAPRAAAIPGGTATAEQARAAATRIVNDPKAPPEKKAAAQRTLNLLPSLTPTPAPTP